MLARRPGSVLATSIGLVAIILTMIIGTITYFENTSRRVNSERWRDVADQAARSGLDMILGWAEASIDKETRLPKDWEMNDGQVADPLRGYAESPGVTVTAAANPRTANPGQLLNGDQVGEYVLARNGNILVTFKARLQQYKISEEMPRQYRLAVVGRVRKASNTPTNLNSDEDGPPGNILSQRMIMAHVGKEPFSKYAALIDIDAVKNWVPGEIVNGPVHINRGYVDDPDTGANASVGLVDDNANLSNNTTYRERRSQMVLHDRNSPVGFQPVGSGIARDNPVFLERVSMTAYSDGTGSGNDDIIMDPGNSTSKHFISFLSFNGRPYADGTLTTAKAQAIFRHPDNQGALPNGQNGPVIEPQPVAMPRSSRTRLTTLLGVRPGNSITQYDWFNRLQDGVYLFTKRTWDTTNPSVNANTSVPSTFTYGSNVDDHPSGGIYIRGNVEIMRMHVSGTYSYYVFQLGYGNGRDTTTRNARRIYIVRVNRAATSKQVDLYAFPVGMNLVSDITFSGGTQSAATINATLASAFNAATTTTNPSDFAIRGPSNSYTYGGSGQYKHAVLQVTPNTNPFPFNGVVFVDLSAHDPARDITNPMGLYLAGGNVPLTGNIYALGDPGAVNNPASKSTGSGASNRGERVATYVGSGASSPASKLTILAAGNVFIQNHLLLQAICDKSGTSSGMNPTQDNFMLTDSRDLLGIVADKQVVIGACAPSAARGSAGVVVHAAIAALGDPGFNFNTNVVPNNEWTGTRAYRGSFTSEGLMQLFSGSFEEEYNILAPVATVANVIANQNSSNGTNNGRMATGTYKYNSSANPNKYPATPLTQSWFNGGAPISSNPNLSPRGNLIIFGSVSQKRRGVVGVSNRSYDKDFRYDKRLMSIAPPLFPTSTNVRLKTSQTFSPVRQRMVYRPTNLSAPDYSIPEHLISVRSQ